MPFLQLTLDIGEADPQPFEDALLVAGASSITLEDAADSPVLEPKPGETPLWPHVKIKALFEGEVNRERLLQTLDALLPSPTPAIQMQTLADRAWEREWLKDFRPMRFGRRLWICPGGQRPSTEELRAQAQTQEPSPLALSRRTGEGESAETVCLVELDPGLAFGTGTHPTTALCLEWLDAAPPAEARVIDYGCGSGILAVAALKLGAREVLGVDIDPQALTASRENAERNDVSARLQLQLAPLQSSPACDVLLANILAGPLEELAPLFAALVRPGGCIVLSGVLREQAARVASVYAPWFDIGPAILRDDWARLDGVRKHT